MVCLDFRTAIRPRELLALRELRSQRCGRAVALAAAAQPFGASKRGEF
jgi:hypothetical protein